jgi:excisionase family DNA binding protein
MPDVAAPDEPMRLEPIRVGWMNQKDTAAYADLDPKLIRGAIERQELRHVRIGRAVRIKPEWVDDWLALLNDGVYDEEDDE